jgi:hypothetical protein
MSPHSLIAALAMSFITLPASAHEGHDHGAAPAATEAGWSPRATARSDDFDLVAAMDGAQMLLWLDRGSDNAPVTDAQIEVEAGAWKGVARPAGDGSYRVDAAGLARPGNHQLVFTVQAGSALDLLPATLVLPAEAGSTDHGEPRAVLPGVAGGIAAVAALGLWWRRRRAAA